MATTSATTTTNNKEDVVMDSIQDNTAAFSHAPEQGFSLFLAKRTKTIHFIRHAEGQHNEANRNFGDDTPVTFSTPGAWKYQDAKLTSRGIQQCIDTKRDLILGGSEQDGNMPIRPQLVVVSPFTRTLQTAHILFGGTGVPMFLVHDLCRERSGKFTCDKRRSKAEILKDVLPLYKSTRDDANLDIESFGYADSEDDIHWSESREPSEVIIDRTVQFMKWLATRPETEIAVVTHSSWLKHLFREFGQQTHTKDMDVLHRLAGNAEIRSVCLALHHGFYPDGEWVKEVSACDDKDDGDDNEVFVPHNPTFRRGRWAPSDERIGGMHANLL